MKPANLPSTREGKSPGDVLALLLTQIKIDIFSLISELKLTRGAFQLNRKISRKVKSLD